MKKILLIGVTYHSDKELHAFVDSVRCAAKRVTGKIQVDIEIVDNGQDNKGYLGGALLVYNTKGQDYDFVSISNVDLQLKEDFFEQLLKIDTNNVGWLVPDIYTSKIDRHENPYMLSRPTKQKFCIWNIIYCSTFIYRVYHYLYLLKGKRTREYNSCNIYAGHGAFMLFTKEFIKHYPQLQFPGFMYGEEIFMAELTHAAQLTVTYTPSLRIDNVGSVSTRLINQKQKSAWSKESLKAIYKKFFD